MPRRFPGPLETLKPTRRVTGLLSSVFPFLLGMTVLAEESSQSSTPNIEFFPSSITLTSGQSWQRLLAWSRDTRNHHQDHTEELTWSESGEDPRLRAQGSSWLAVKPGSTLLEARNASGHIVGHVPVTVHPAPSDPTLSFLDDIQPILTKTGCNNGACHAKPGGRNGFELSVFGYDPASDYRQIVHEGRGRRIFPPQPERSLLLLKPTQEILHEGGKVLDPGSPFHQQIIDWMNQGMRYQNEQDPLLTHISLHPEGGRLSKSTSFHSMVQAHYDDGSIRDVSHLAEWQSSDKDILIVEEDGLATTGDREGTVVMIARFSGMLDETRWTVPREHESRQLASRFAQLPPHNLIDELAFPTLQELGYLPSEACSDTTFIRRTTLDAAGVLPSREDTERFLSDRRRDKRERWIESLLTHRWIGDHWAIKWTDLLRPNPDRAGIKSVYMFDQWVRQSFRKNMPYDAFVRSILTLEGSNHGFTPASIYRDKRTPEDRTILFSQLFLGVRLECAKCHHHPFEKWGQEDFYQTAAIFQSVKQKGAGVSPPISAGTETFYFESGGEIKHPRTEEIMQPTPPGGGPLKYEANEDPRNAWVHWMMREDNPYFSQAIVNRVWAVFFGKGFVDPVDDFRTSNPAVHQSLLEALAKDFVAHGYDLRHLMRTIMSSRLYQSSSTPNDTNIADTRYFSRYYRKRLPAEVLLDAVSDITHIPESFEGMPPGSRAVETWNFKISSQFLDAFDRPNSSSDPPCERINTPSVVQALHLMHSEAIQRKLHDDEGWVAKLANQAMNPEQKVEEIYLTLFSRRPNSTEIPIAMKAISGERQREGLEDLVWALLNSAEFVFNH